MIQSRETMGLIFQSKVEINDKWSHIDKCGGRKQSSFEYHTPKNTPV